MNRPPALLIALFLSAASLVGPRAARGADDAAFTRTEDVVYGRKHGMALTMDVFTPKQDANGAAVLWMVSGGWFSAHEAINAGMVQEFLNRGYTVFAVVHGSQPKFTIPEAVADVKRAVRFVRYHAKDYKIDPDRLGVTGASAGGHLSLMLGMTGEEGDPKAKDPVDRVSSRVQAVACFFPPTDFLNYGKAGENALGRGILKGFKAPFDFNKLDPDQHIYRPISDEAKVLEIGREISPAYHITPDDPPTLIFHGDADKLVPIQQAEMVIEKLKTAGVDCKLVVKKGAGHGWADHKQDLAVIADWFDAHLKPKPESKPKPKS